MRTASAAFLALALVMLPPGAGGEARQQQTAGACTMDTQDRAWIEQALRNWRDVERLLLRLPPSPLPLVVAVDGVCTWNGREAADGRMSWTGEPHRGTVTFPGGGGAPLGPISFAAPAEGTVPGFFAMSLPSVWRAAGVKSDLGLESLMDGVLLHEMAHTRQFSTVGPEMERLDKLYSLPDDIDDNVVQQTFAGNPEYVADFERERDLLFAAAAASSDAEARRLAAAALATMRARHAKWFTGANAKLAPLDDLFLTMEGLGQWVAFAWFTHPDGAALPVEKVLPAVRRGGRQWSQDQGLAIFLTVDRLVPGWQAQLFGAKPLLATALLELAATQR